ncbi:putative RNA helicase armitage [Arctopsyche grandis]|uniref:putative RNA helicase armitage n=1 Tax=Arctopsyche grandis TaxID=121162 RepID=UPI00406D8FAE
MALTFISELAGFVWFKLTYKEPLKTDDEILDEYISAHEKEKNCMSTIDPDSTLLKTNCIKCTGKITRLTDSSGIIDGRLKFSLENSNHLQLKVNDVVNYLIFQLNEDEPPKVSRILSVLETFWDSSENGNKEFLPHGSEQEYFDIVDRVLVGKVIKREGRNVTIEPNNVKFNLDHVVSNFLPMVGDWVEICGKVQQEKNVLFGNDIGEILEVTTLACLRSEIVEGKITKLEKDNGWGIVDNRILFNILSCNASYNLKIGDEVIVDAIESDQGKLSWRALSIVVKTSYRKNTRKITTPVVYNENKNGIIISTKLDFGDMKIGDENKIDVEISNTKDSTQFMYGIQHKSDKNSSQIEILHDCNSYIIIPPKGQIRIEFKCVARFLGVSKELIVFKCQGFDLTRQFNMKVIDPRWAKNAQTANSLKYESKLDIIIDNMRYKKKTNFIPGVRPCKPPPFIKVRTPIYSIPIKLWEAYLEYSGCSQQDAKHLIEFENKLSLPPFISINNYNLKFHTLLFIDEIQYTIRYKMYNSDNVFMTTVGEFFRLYIENLHEKRPCLLVGDSVRVKNPWNINMYDYEGFIHKIQSDCILIKFSADFHKKYNGEDVCIEFFFSRSAFQKCHFAIDLAATHLGPQILFPDKMIINQNQLEIEESNNETNESKGNEKKSDMVKVSSDLNANSALKMRKIIWFNKSLNEVQKNAVRNILCGITRPLPYVIFGPPGTGKTMTLIEVILQIVTLLPNSRLLIATPSNSAANSLCERLIKCGKFHPGFLIRLVSMSHIAGGGLPDHLKPFCATLNVSLENSNQSKFRTSDGIRFECSKSFIGRHRITIGTCVCLGSLVKMGFPAGHFTHILVDEAGQATEPEIMIPLAFINKNSGQIILAGDPMQLGPVVISDAAKKLGLNLSFLERLLACFPYKKDYIGHGRENGGYDPRLVTKLKYNYRSLPNIIQFSNKYFYDSGIVSTLHMNDKIKSQINNLASVFDMDESKYPGIFFHGVRGNTYRGYEDPSWFNPEEASMVMLYLCKLYKHKVASDDIGIVTPYTQQVKHIRALVNDMGIAVPKVGTVEEFQGQERKVIILSTVRSNEDCQQHDIEKLVGFIGHPKRMNVAFTRAQFLLIIIGNPHVLVLDSLWSNAIQYIISLNGYLGSDIPAEMLNY